VTALHAVIHWLEAVAGDVPADDHWLSAAERRTLARLHVPKRRADWRLGRWTAKHAGAAVLGVAPERLAVRALESGAPELLLDDRPARLAMSLSHSGGRAVCALAPGGTALGCDLETIEARSGAFEADHLTAEEREVVERGADHDLGVTLVWSAKESAAKAIGEGWRLDPYDLVVRVPVLSGDTEWRPLRVETAPEGEGMSGWWRVEGGQVRTMVSAPTLAPAAL